MLYVYIGLLVCFAICLAWAKLEQYQAQKYQAQKESALASEVAANHIIINESMRDQKVYDLKVTQNANEAADEIKIAHGDRSELNRSEF